MGRTLPLSDLWRLHGATSTATAQGSGSNTAVIGGRVAGHGEMLGDGAEGGLERERARELSGDTVVASPIKRAAMLAG